MFKVRVPATSANMGPCFDTAGIALSLYNEVEVYTGREAEGRPLIESDCRIDPRIRCDETIPTDESNLIYSTIRDFCRDTGAEMPRFALCQRDSIPLTRGLGSSAACIAAGLVIGNRLTGDRFSPRQLLDMAVRTEGHPDNVAPAFLGGMVVGAIDGDRFDYVRIPVSDRLAFLTLVPSFTLSTSKARSVLPESYTRAQAVFNCSRAALLVASLMSGNFDALAVAVQDAIHQPYRKALVPDMQAVFDKAMTLGSYGGYLSGAGPTLLLVNPADKNAEIAARMQEFTGSADSFRLVMPLAVDTEGIVVTEQL